MTKAAYKEGIYDTVKSYFEAQCVLIVTATDIETAATHTKMRPLPGYTQLIRFYNDTLTFYLGQFGRYTAVHIQCAMGSLSRDSSIITTTAAINLIKPKIVLMPGIAFGINSQEQKIGDVIVAETIYPYNNKRVGKNEVVHRGVPLTASKLLINRFKNIKSNWEYLIDKNKKAGLNIGAILSGEELIDNKSHRDSLLKKFPMAKGGEMEGAGLYGACDGHANFILVKGICDFADGNKGTNKKKNQKIAIESALSACLEVFSSTTAFESIGLKALNSVCTECNYSDSNPSDILFDVYTKDREKYYISRAIDESLVKVLQHYGVWVYGISGCGKSNYILRNLIRNKIDYLYISLGSCINVPVDDFFKEILYELASKPIGDGFQLQPNNFSECSKQIISILEKNYKNKFVVIFIEEIPVHNNEEEKDFIEKIVSLIVSKSMVPGLEGIKFILSSISDPQYRLHSHHQKVLTHLKFIKLENWLKKDIIILIELIELELQIPLSAITKEKLIDVSKCSPRFIKKFFRNVLSEQKKDEASIIAMIELTKIELSQI